KNLAKVSGRPGATRLINFFRIDRKWSLVDLPGYGYAKRGKGTRDEFEDMIADYLTGREALRCAFVLLSGELPPQQVDLEFCGWLALQGVPFVLVFTKADKVKKGRLEANVAAFLEEFAEYCDGEPRVFLSSAKNGEGRRELLAFLSQAM
ncbi:MAG: ribosome biogenesis GTP-binding protein YihA/YsxC, partial [Verrucomicrobiales bacterium]